MSLKAFHLLFVAASVLLSLGLCVWALDAYFTRSEGGMLVLAGCGFLLGIGLAVYGVKVRAKLKQIGGL